MLLNEIKLKPDLLVLTMLQKLLDKGEKVKVNLRLGWDPEGGKKKLEQKDEIFNVLRLVNKPEPVASTKIYTDAPDEWFELNTDDDDNITIKKQDDGTFLMTMRDGTGILV